MSAYENVIGGKLKLKGKPLDVISGGVKKKKKKQKKLYEDVLERKEEKLEESSHVVDDDEEENSEFDKLGGEEKVGNFGDHLTPAEKRYIEQREKLDAQKHVKTSTKSHRDRLNDFNQYLANLSEHYDIPKVGPG